MKIDTKYIELHIYTLNPELKFLLLKRSKKQKLYPNIWQMVSGKINDGESAFEAAIREMKEETGLDIYSSDDNLNKEFEIIPRVNSFYSLEDDTIYLVPVFACQLDFEAKISLSNEHADYAWLSYKETRSKLLWDGQKKVVDLIHDRIDEL